MKRLIPFIVLLFVIFLHTAVFAQSGEGKIDYQKGDKVAATLELPYTYDIVEDAIKTFMERKGAKADLFKLKGFVVFRNARLQENSNELCDVYCKVERKALKEKETSVVYALIGRPGENIGARTADDRFKVVEAKELLNKIQPAVEAHNLDIAIKKQEEQVKKAEKKLLTLKDDQYDLEKKLQALQEKLAQNKNDQTLQTEELNRQKGFLLAIQSQKK